MISPILSKYIMCSVIFCSHKCSHNGGYDCDHELATSGIYDNFVIINVVVNAMSWNCEISDLVCGQIINICKLNAN